MARRFRYKDEEVDEDELREMILDAIDDHFVANGPTGSVNADDDFFDDEEDDEDWDDDEVTNSEYVENDDDDDYLDLPVINNKRFASDLKLPNYPGSDEDDEDDDELDLPYYDPAAFKLP